MNGIKPNTIYSINGDGEWCLIDSGGWTKHMSPFLYDVIRMGEERNRRTFVYWCTKTKYSTDLTISLRKILTDNRDIGRSFLFKIWEVK